MEALIVPVCWAEIVPIPTGVGVAENMEVATVDKVPGTLLVRADVPTPNVCVIGRIEVGGCEVF